MDDDFDNDIDLADDHLDDSLSDLGDLGDAGDSGDPGDGDADADVVDESSELGGRRSSGGARVTARLAQPEPAAARAPRPAAPKTKKAAKRKAAPKKKKAAPKKTSKKSKKAKKAKPARRKAGSRK